MYMTYVFFAITESILNKQNNYVDDYGHHSRFSNDLVICFVKFLLSHNKKESLLIAYTHGTYRGKGKKTGTLIHHLAALQPLTIAHEIGHILGAEHGFNEKPRIIHCRG